MNRMVLERFCADYNVDKESVNPEILGLLRGASKDHLKAYNRLQKFRVLQQTAKDSKVSFQEILDLLNAIRESGKSFDDVLKWLQTD